MTTNEATCQGCYQCKWGGIYPCPSQSPAKRRELLKQQPAWLRRLQPKDLTGQVQR